MNIFKIKPAFFSIMVLLIIASSCDIKKESTENIENEDSDTLVITKAQLDLNNMAIGKAETKDFPMTVNVTGMIDVPPQNKAMVNAIKGGYIKRTPLLVGNVVKKGDFLVSIENPEFLKLQQSYLEVKSQLSFLEMEYQRQKQLFEENISSQKNYLKAESDYNTAKASSTGLRKQLEMLNFSVAQIETGQMTSVTNIYAPISGVISTMNIAMGSFVADATTILEIVDTEHIHLELNIFEKDILRLKIGQSIQFKIPEASQETFEAQIYLIGATIQPNRTIQVHAHLMDESNHNFLPGMFVEAAIQSDVRQVMALPEEAVVSHDDEHFVLQLVETSEAPFTFKKQRVDIGVYRDGFVEILSALEKDAQFLIKGAYYVMGE
ncbi:efflux RND transporter periplasmic adaptor subunit [Paucihalobacter sp.]|uniref:efflux RND transporter periplasmic adaptor subunit n=1 Tax=Paucihalobacter sp. TaxID=2850405 RepID=UPI003D1612E4